MERRRDLGQTAPGHRETSLRNKTSTLHPTASAYFSIVVRLGRVARPRSRRDTALCVVHILRATSR